VPRRRASEPPVPHSGRDCDVTPKTDHRDHRCIALLLQFFKFCLPLRVCALCGKADSFTASCVKGSFTFNSIAGCKQISLLFSPTSWDIPVENFGHPLFSTTSWDVLSFSVIAGAPFHSRGLTQAHQELKPLDFRKQQSRLLKKYRGLGLNSIFWRPLQSRE
jgi:hypothetical protein